MIISERSNGKTYSVKDYVEDKSKNDEGLFVYLRRRQRQVSRNKLRDLFSDQEELCMSKFGDIIHYSVEKGFYWNDYEDVSHTIGYAMSVEKAAETKGIPWNEVTTIFFDEFLEYGSPIENEISLFLNIISTIVRKRTNVEVYMVANTITKFSPYFELFGIDPKKLKQGQIMYGKHKNGVTFAIEYCKSANIVNGKKQQNKYLGFDNNPTADMILYGEWEYDVVNTKEVDQNGWSTERYLIPMYITALGEVYELSLYEGNDPIAFVRKLDTQNGMVRQEIRYNLTYDSSLKLVNKNGVVPMYGKINELVDADVREMYKIFKLCIEAKRVVFNTMATGSDFTKIIPYI